MTTQANTAQTTITDPARNAVIVLVCIVGILIAVEAISYLIGFLLGFLIWVFTQHLGVVASVLYLTASAWVLHITSHRNN